MRIYSAKIFAIFKPQSSIPIKGIPGKSWFLWSDDVTKPQYRGNKSLFLKVYWSSLSQKHHLDIKWHAENAHQVQVQNASLLSASYVCCAPGAWLFSDLLKCPFFTNRVVQNTWFNDTFPEGFTAYCYSDSFHAKEVKYKSFVKVAHVFVIGIDMKMCEMRRNRPSNIFTGLFFFKVQDLMHREPSFCSTKSPGQFWLHDSWEHSSARPGAAAGPCGGHSVGLWHSVSLTLMHLGIWEVGIVRRQPLWSAGRSAQGHRYVCATSVACAQTLHASHLILPSCGGPPSQFFKHPCHLLHSWTFSAS